MLKILNQIIRVWERIKGDIPTRIALSLIGFGVTLLSGGRIGYLTSLSYSNTEGATITLNLNIGDIYIAVASLGGLLIFVGLIMSIRRFRILEESGSLKDTALIFFPGFQNMNNQIPIDELPKNIKSKTININFDKMDSYNPKTIISKYHFNADTIKQRIYHSGTKTVYLAALGSVPYLYLTGTMFRNGHLHLQILEHDRNEDMWHLLDIVGMPKSLSYQYADKTDQNEIIQVMENSQSEDIGVAISFTNIIRPSELPEIIRDRTISIGLNSKFEFDALPCKSEQDKIVNEIDHFLTSIFKCTSRVHLFICAQASFVINLGRLYQDGMMGSIIIHNYDPSSKSYNWAIRFDGSSLTLEKE